MAVEQSIIDALESSAAEFNANEQKAVKAEVRVPEGHPHNIAQGRGNAEYGRHCIYEMVLVPNRRRFRYSPVLQVKHYDGRPYPATITISNPPQEETVTSENALKEAVRKILDSAETSETVESLGR